MPRADPLKLSALVLGTQQQGGGFAPRLEFSGEPVAIGMLEIYGVPEGRHRDGGARRRAAADGAPLATAQTTVAPGDTEDMRIAFGGFSIATPRARRLPDARRRQPRRQAGRQSRRTLRKSAVGRLSQVLGSRGSRALEVPDSELSARSTVAYARGSSTSVVTASRMAQAVDRQRNDGRRACSSSRLTGPHASA